MNRKTIPTIAALSLLISTQALASITIKPTSCVLHDSKPCIELAQLDGSLQIKLAPTLKLSTGPSAPFSSANIVSITADNATEFGDLSLQSDATTSARKNKDLIKDLTQKSPTLPYVDPHVIFTIKTADKGCGEANQITTPAPIKINKQPYLLCYSYAD